MALSLSDEAQTQRWSIERAGAPTTLRLAQLRRVGSFSSDHEQGEEDVASVQHTAKGWQITRHATAIDIAVQRDFGGFPGFTVRLRDPGAVALLCHRDTVTFSCAQTANEARLTVELSPGAATDDDEELSDAESEELCDDHGEAPEDGGDDEETADFVPEFQRLSQESAERFSQSQRSLGSQSSNADSAAPIGSQSSVGSACSWEEPDSLELDSGSDQEDFAAAPRAAPDAGAAKAKASPAMIRYSQEERRGAAAQEPGGGMSSGALASSFALLGGGCGGAGPEPTEVAREMEERVGASGEAAPWSCDSCHYLCSGLASSCELCSAPRGPPTAAATATDTIVDLTDDSVAAAVPASTGGAKRDQAQAQAAPKQQTKRRKLESQPRAQAAATATATTTATATASAATAVTATAVTASAAQAAASATARPAAAKQGKARAGGRDQPDRRKTASDFKNGLGPLPPVTLNMDATVPSREVKVGGADGVLVHWPSALHPSRPQVCCEHLRSHLRSRRPALNSSQVCVVAGAAHASRRGRARRGPTCPARKPDRHGQNARAPEHVPRHAVGAAGGGEGSEEALLAALGLCEPDTRTAGSGDPRAQAPAVS